MAVIDSDECATRQKAAFFSATFFPAMELGGSGA
jgi:hypothetical protein